jgi:hypothetical protein
VSGPDRAGVTFRPFAITVRPVICRRYGLKNPVDAVRYTTPIATSGRSDTGQTALAS